MDSLHVKGLIDVKFVAREKQGNCLASLPLVEGGEEEGEVWSIRWVRGHTGDVGNAMADELGDMGTRPEEVNRWWKRVQPMGHCDALTFRKKLENGKERTSEQWCFECTVGRRRELSSS